MEAIIRKQALWMDEPWRSTDVVNYLANDPDGHFREKYDARETIGDIAQIENDGYWSDPITGKGYDFNKFYLVCVPGEEIPDISSRALYDQQGNLKAARTHNIDISLITFDENSKAILTRNEALAVIRGNGNGNKK